MELNPNFYNNAKKACENQSEFKNYKELCQALGEDQQIIFSSSF